MTADERIERLLSRFGQTISDLPKPDSSSYAYGKVHRKKANYATKKWAEGLGLENNEDYICHLADIIDRMEIALETAFRWMPCYLCKNASECSKNGMEDLHCVRPCHEKAINDYMLHDQ